MEDQVVDHLLAGAKVVEEPLGYEAALKPDPAPADEDEDD